MQDPIKECDVLIIGSGIAGASLGYFLLEGENAPKTIMLEAEAVPAFHTTGRSAAFLLPYYGGGKVVPLTRFSRRFYENPPKGFAATPLLHHRGALHIANDAQMSHLAEYFEQASPLVEGMEMKTSDEVCAQVPVLDRSYVAGGIYDPGCFDLDVSAIHTGFLSGFGQAGGQMFLNSPVGAISHDGSAWHLLTKTGEYRAKTIVNAAGAWGDEVAQMAGLAPLGLMPLRRTVIVCPVTGGVDKNWPLVIDIDEDFYFRPEGGNILASPGDETPSAPCNSQPEEEDVAKIAYDLERITAAPISKIANKWAGLRTFTPDRVPAMGFDAGNKGFFWCVGQGGFGIQTAAAMGRMSADMLLERPINPELANLGAEEEDFSPARF